MADECLTTTAEPTDCERRSLGPDVDCVTTGVPAAEAPSTGVAFLDMPTSVLEISDAVYSVGGDDNDSVEQEENDGLPYPGYVEKAFFYFLQTTRPRNWCLQLIVWPYPFCTHRMFVMYLIFNHKNFERHVLWRICIFIGIHLH